MSIHSCLYEGVVRHRRFAKPASRFSYRLFLIYLDLDEIPGVFRGHWLWSADRPNFAWFRRADHLGSPDQPLAQSVRALVKNKVGSEPTGPIRLLTQLRYMGLGMNPVSLYYCFDDREALEYVVAEVNNTPWGEQHSYVLDVRSATRAGRLLEANHPKEFHVSPFLGMAMDYGFRFREPGNFLTVHVENRSRDAEAQRLFDATLHLKRKPISSYELARVISIYPLITVQIFLKIYWQALRLWIRRARFYPHPKHGRNRSAASQVESSEAQKAGRGLIP
jgi:DUF1365 family protein